MTTSYFGRPSCGCWYIVPGQYQAQRKYLPQVDLNSSTQILATTSRTTLTQTFVNPSKSDKLDEVQYTFPLYDGVSVVGFQCTVASRIIVGVVKEKQQARADYQEAIDRGETAGLLEQLPEASDVFTTKVGNVPAGEKIIVEIVYLGELKHDAETDGSRFTIPTFIAPRYGNMSADSANAFSNQASDKGGIRILVDVVQEEGSVVRGLQSPSHPIAVTMGRTSAMDEEAFDNNRASATLTLGSTELDKDFVIVVLAKGQDTPRALLETHSSIPDQRAIMTTLVPKFNLPNIHPEIVFIVDRSGSMEGKIETLVSAMKIFLKSLPIGVKFNICSFGSNYDFLFKKSKTYDQTSMQEALKHLSTFSANYGGTEMLQPVKGTVKNRFKDMPLEIMLITDGEIWNQEELFGFINKSAKNDDMRFFSLGIGVGASSSLVEGIARAGNGFAQFVGDNEKMDKRVVRMLKGALTPHIKDYSLEVKYGMEDDDMDEGFEMVESANESLKVVVTDMKKPSPKQKVISLFNTSAEEEPPNPKAGRYDHLPSIATPKILQAPHKIPPLYPFNRTTVYLLMSKDACSKTPKAVVLRATSQHGPLELEIPIQDVGHGQSIHQLAAKKAVHELEEGRGWITQAKNADGKLVSSQFEGRWDEIVEREAVQLGVQFQVGGKWCSFVAVEKNMQGSEVGDEEEEGWEIQDGSEEGVKDDGSDDRARASRGRGASLFGAVRTGAAGKSIFGVNHSKSSPENVQGSPNPFATAPLISNYHGDRPLFGSLATPSTSAQAPSGSLFSVPAPTIQAFGSSASSLFGGSGASGGVFGGSKASHPGLPSQNAVNPPSFSFGSTSAVSNSNHSPSSGFGGLRMNEPASKSTTTNPASGINHQAPGGLFGSSTAFSSDAAPRPSTELEPQQHAGGLFSSTQSNFGTQPTVSSFGFGATNPSLSADAKATTLFGNNVGTNTLFTNPLPSTTAQADTSPVLARSKARKSVARTGGANFPPALHSSYVSYALHPSYASPQPAPLASQMPMSQGMLSMAHSAVQATQARTSQMPMKRMQQSSPPVAYRRSSRSAAVPHASHGFTRSYEAADMDEESDEDMGFGMDTAVEPSYSLVSPQSSTPTGPPAPGHATMSDEAKMHALIDLQTFDGSWALDDALLAIVGVSREQLAAAMAGKRAAKAEKVQATIAAIVWLESKVGKERDVWEMVVEKARAWVEGVVGGGFEAQEAEVKKVIGA